MALKIRRGTDAERALVTFAEGELIYVIDTDELYVGDGSTLGGVRLAGSALSSIGNMLAADTLNNELDLQRNLNLSGNNIIGTGNINITGSINATGNITAGGNIDIGDNSGDTLTIVAQVDSNITPTSDTTYDLGGISARWRNGYFTGLTVDGQISADSINGNVIADDSTVMVNAATNTFTGDLTGDVQGNVTGDVQGNVTGDVQGNVTGNVTGNVNGDLKGSVFADDSSILVDAVAGVLRGDHLGILVGNVKAPNGFTILNAGTDGTDASIAAELVGNVQGNVTGNLIGNVTGNLEGDVVGSVFADNSTLLVDAVNGTIPGSAISGTVTADLVGDVSGNLQGNVTGNVNGDLTGNVFTNSIDSADSSAIVVTPKLQTLSDLVVDQALIIGPDQELIGSETVTVKIIPGQQNEFGLERGGAVYADSIFAKRFNIGSELAGNEIEFTSPVAFFDSLSVDEGVTIRKDSLFLQVNDEDFSLRFSTFTGNLGNPVEAEDPNNYNDHFKINKSAGTFNVPVKFPVVADDAARSTLVPSPEKGMVILMESGTTPAATNQLQFFDGTNWVNV